MPTPAKAFTTTPDPAAGNPVDVVTLDAGAGTVDRQVFALGDPTTGAQYAIVSAAGAVKVDPSAVTQPVSAVSLPLPTGAATGATQTDGTQKAITRGGAKGVTAAADLTGTAEGADHHALDVQLYHGAVAKDPTAIRALTSADVVTTAPPANQSVNVNQIGGTGITLGQKAMASSEPVTIASDQSAVPVSGTVAVSTIAGAITPGTAAANLGKAEDAGHVSGDTGILALAVRVDVPNLPTAAPTSANTDYAAVATDAYGVTWVRKRQLPTYTANYRLAEAASQLDLTFTFAANTNKQVATIYHTAGATKTVKIRKVSVFYTTLTAAIIGVELRALSLTTAPATGNPAIIPRQHDPADGAAEATCLALPTTAGSVVGADNATVSAHVSINAAITTASTSPATFGTTGVVLYEYKDGSEEKPLTMRAANAEGYAVIMRSTAATAQRFTVVIKFTEE